MYIDTIVRTHNSRPRLKHSRAGSSGNPWGRGQGEGLNNMFKLHPQLEKDTIDIGRFELCRLLLMNDANYPWFILVPEREK